MINGAAAKPVPTGFADLDMALTGLAPGTLTLIAGRLGVGRSTLLLTFCRNAAVRHRVPAVFFTYRISDPELRTQILAAETSIPLPRMTAGQLDDADWRCLSECMATLAESPLLVHPSAALTRAELVEYIRETIPGEQRLVAIDSVHDVPADVPEDDQIRRTADTLRALKATAAKLNIPIVASVAWSTWISLDGGDARPPIADNVILLHREDVDDPETPRAGEADLIVITNLHGPTATVTVAYQPEHSRFVDFPVAPSASTISSPKR